jgi:hypothetical protein
MGKSLCEFKQSQVPLTVSCCLLPGGVAFD